MNLEELEKEVERRADDLTRSCFHSFLSGSLLVPMQYT